MNFSRYRAALGLGVLAILPVLVRAMPAEELFRRISPSVWVVRPLDAQGKSLGTGSGVVIEPGRLVTNCHVLAKAAAILVKHENVSFQAELEFPDIERDLCSIKVANFSAPAVQIAPLDTVRVGQKIYTIGTPFGLEQTMSDGLVSALRRGRDGAVENIQISAPISPGSSGGGLFDEQGRLVGITTSGLSATAGMAPAQNLNFARPAQWIFDLPERGRLALASYKKPASTAGASTAVAGKQHLDAPMLVSKTWSYPHPRDAATFGNVELTFSTAGVHARNAKSSADGTWEIRDDTLCANLDSPGWGRLCFYLVKDGDDVQLVNASSGIRSKLTVR
ncbi:S1C family serine protease [Variovorax sp. PAMC26660]|uniref:S1C family serine protease n=1 Tax=Variovorax sp. PAMC26660 TaxID=2762322 RepID=UPI00164D1B85|nr:S1C family serine protease [Variovorax sp. PAMC26660]QNK67281.1 serine protease [Variovorax sp. PAMC26660]